MEEFVCATFFFLLASVSLYVKAVQEIFFSNLSPPPPHPHYQKLNGSPLSPLQTGYFGVALI